jgi:hypothetical protein
MEPTASREWLVPGQLVDVSAALPPTDRPQLGSPPLPEQIIQLQPWQDVLLALTDGGSIYRLTVEKPGSATVHKIELVYQGGPAGSMFPARDREPSLRFGI